MAKRLVRLGDEVHVVAPYMVDDVPDHRVEVHRFPLPPIGYRNIVGHSLIILRAYRELKRLGPLDVIHTPEYHSAAIISSLNRDTPLVFTEPGNIYERIVYGNPYDTITTQVYKLAARIAARRCARLIATSEWMKEWWHRTGVPLDRITVIPLGVDTKLFHPRRGARRVLGFPEGVPILLCVTRLSKENGVNVVLQGAAMVMRDVSNCELHVVGSGPEQERLMTLANELGISEQTIWHGWVDLAYLPFYYSAADLFVFAGRSGGTPRVLLQAMACGAPVLASRIGGIVDHVAEGRTGLLFEPGVAEALARQASYVLMNRDFGSELGCKACEYARTSLDWDVLAEKIHEVYVTLTPRKVSR